MAMSRLLRPLIAVFGAIALASPFIFKLDRLPSPSEDHPVTRRLDIAIDDSDPLATATMSVVSRQDPHPAVSSGDHKKLSEILSETRKLIIHAKTLLDANGRDEAREIVNLATAKFKAAKEHIRASKAEPEKLRAARPQDRKEKEEDGTEIVDDVDRAMDVSRNMYETYISFPECIGHLFDDCLEIINSDLTNLGMSTVEIVVHEKRNPDQDGELFQLFFSSSHGLLSKTNHYLSFATPRKGYNKVVIVTNLEASAVVGRTGDGIVSYPFSWDDSVHGSRVLGVDGKWNCRDMSPEDCCENIKESCTNPDSNGNYLECHIFVPFGGVGNARRNDRVFINLSSDGRVHEAPQIQ